MWWGNGAGGAAASAAADASVASAQASIRCDSRDQPLPLMRARTCEQTQIAGNRNAGNSLQPPELAPAAAVAGVQCRHVTVNRPLERANAHREQTKPKTGTVCCVQHGDRTAD